MDDLLALAADAPSEPEKHAEAAKADEPESSD